MSLTDALRGSIRKPVPARVAGTTTWALLCVDAVAVANVLRVTGIALGG